MVGLVGQGLFRPLSHLHRPLPSMQSATILSLRRCECRARDGLHKRGMAAKATTGQDSSTNSRSAAGVFASSMHEDEVLSRLSVRQPQAGSLSGPHNAAFLPIKGHFCDCVAETPLCVLCQVQGLFTWWELGQVTQAYSPFAPRSSWTLQTLSCMTGNLAGHLSPTVEVEVNKVTACQKELVAEECVRAGWYRRTYCGSCTVAP